MAIKQYTIRCRPDCPTCGADGLLVTRVVRTPLEDGTTEIVRRYRCLACPATGIKQKTIVTETVVEEEPAGDQASR